MFVRRLEYLDDPVRKVVGCAAMLKPNASVINVTLKPNPRFDKHGSHVPSRRGGIQGASSRKVAPSNQFSTTSQNADITSTNRAPTARCSEEGIKRAC